MNKYLIDYMDEEGRPHTKLLRAVTPEKAIMVAEKLLGTSGTITSVSLFVMPEDLSDRSHW